MLTYFMVDDIFEKLKPLAQRVVKQHYVPQAYLARFCESDGGLFALDKTDLRVFKSGPRAVAFEKEFYELDDEAVDDAIAQKFNDYQVAEQALAVIEADFQGAVNLLLSEGPYVGISRDLRARIAGYVAIQYLRTVEAREKIIDSYNAGLNVIHSDELKRHFGKDASEYRVAAAESHHSAIHLKMLFDPEILDPLINAIFANSWVLEIANDGSEFVTSDHPVAKRAYVVGQREAFDGFRSPGIRISFPLSRKYCLDIRDPAYHRDFAEHDGRTMKIDESSVRSANRMQVNSSRRWLFGSGTEFADEIAFCRKHTFMRDPCRTRTVVHEGKEIKHSKGSRQLIHMRSPERKIVWDAGF